MADLIQFWESLACTGLGNTSMNYEMGGTILSKTVGATMNANMNCLGTMQNWNDSDKYNIRKACNCIRKSVIVSNIHIEVN